MPLRQRFRFSPLLLIIDAISIEIIIADISPFSFSLSLPPFR
jgi:hypothetical protein